MKLSFKHNDKNFESDKRYQGRPALLAQQQPEEAGRGSRLFAEAGSWKQQPDFRVC
jgi:hypothetical protein